MNIEEAARQTENDIYDRHHPEGHPHPPWWEHGYVGGSTITQETALKIAEEGVAGIEGRREEDYVPDHYSFRGDTYHEGSHPPEDGWVHELEYRIPIGYEGRWGTSQIIGHVDSVRVVDGHVQVAEHKAYGHLYEDKRRNAYAQGILGAAGLLHTVHAHIRHDDPLDWHPLAEPVDLDGTKGVEFYETEYSDDGFGRGDRTFVWSGDWNIDAVAVHLTAVDEDPAHLDPDPYRDHTVFTADELFEFRDYYEEKAAAILRAVDGQDPVVAYQDWDLEHPEEFAFDAEDPDTFFGPDPDLAEALARYEHAKEEAKRWKKLKGKWRSRAVQALKDRDAEEAEGDWGAVEMRFRDGSRDASVTSLDDTLELVEEMKEGADEGTAKVLNELKESIQEAISDGSPYHFPDIKDLDSELLDEVAQEDEW